MNETTLNPTVMLCGRFFKTHKTLKELLKARNIHVGHSVTSNTRAAIIGQRPGTIGTFDARSRSLPLLGPDHLKALLEGAHIDQVIEAARHHNPFCAPTNSVLTQLRSLIHDEPNVATFERICALLETCDPDMLPVAMEYVQNTLDSWPILGAHSTPLHPALLGLPPYKWRTALTRGIAMPHFGVIRALSLYGYSPHESWKQLDNAALRPLRALQCYGYKSDLLERLQHPKLRQLEYLAIRNQAPFELLQQISRAQFPRLRTLACYGFMGSLEALDNGGSHKIQRLDLHGNVEMLTRSVGLPNLFDALQRVNIGAGILASGLHATNFVKSLGPSLQSLDMSHNNIGWRCVRAIFNNTDLPNLNALTLNNCNVRRSAMRQIRESKQLRGLQSLSLTHNKIGQRALGMLSRAEGFTQLRHLDLSHNCLTPDAVRTLLDPQTPLNASLRSLNLRANAGIGVAAAEALRDNPELCRRLKFIDLNATTLGSRGYALLRNNPALANTNVNTKGHP